MTPKGKMTVREMGRLGGKARASKYPPDTLALWAARGGHARAERHTPEERKAFAKNSGRKPWKITPEVRRRIVDMLIAGRTRREVAAKFGISLRSVGRVVSQEQQSNHAKG